MILSSLLSPPHTPSRNFPYPPGQNRVEEHHFQASPFHFLLWASKKIQCSKLFCDAHAYVSPFSALAKMYVLAINKQKAYQHFQVSLSISQHGGYFMVVMQSRTWWWLYLNRSTSANFFLFFFSRPIWLCWFACILVPSVRNSLPTQETHFRQKLSFCVLVWMGGRDGETNDRMEGRHVPRTQPKMCFTCRKL